MHKYTLAKLLKQLKIKNCDTHGPDYECDSSGFQMFAEHILTYKFKIKHTQMYTCGVTYVI